jgi:hypothetical protein
MHGAISGRGFLVLGGTPGKGRGEIGAPRRSYKNFIPRRTTGPL